ncbi:hypothetical protein V6N13_053996 [Hibiscus sabdariffa]|uniref:Uncharacterized protein n=1 Tax=Hibiscus sabdariffa TaxID=183260 RepID=A0ABR2T6W4_9ROSI
MDGLISFCSADLTLTEVELRGTDVDLMVSIGTIFYLSYRQSDNGAPAKGAYRGLYTRGGGIRLVMAAKGQCALCTHLVATVLNFNCTDLLEAYAAYLGITSLHRNNSPVNIISSIIANCKLL